MSQMPDKIWLHKDTKYNTTDEVFGYQYEFAQEIQDEGIENFIEYIPLNTFIEKACEWLEYNYTEFLDSSRLGINIEELVKDFRNDFKTE